MRKSVIIAACLLFSAAAWGQNAIKDIVAIIRGKDVVSCSYTYTMRGSMPVKASGTAEIQGHRYHTTADGGLETWCDGTTCWMVDRKAKEVLIAEAGESMVSHLDEYIGYVHISRFDGKNLSCTIVREDRDVDLDFSASGITLTESSASDDSRFVFDVSTLDSSWIVTDLR